MKRPLLLFTLFLAAGILTGARTGNLFTACTAALLPAVCFAVPFCIFREHRFLISGVILCFAAGVLGFYAADSLNETRFAEFNGRIVEIRGIVVSEPDIRESRVRYTVKVKEVRLDGAAAAVKGKLRLTTTWKGESSTYHYGDAIKFSGKLRVPNEIRNPGGLNFRRQLAATGISATLFSTKEQISLLGETKANFLLQAGIQVRNRMVQVIRQSLPPEQAGLLNGILIGYREDLSEEVRQVFSDAGLSHVMAVSGANIAFILLPVTFVFKKARMGSRKASLILLGVITLYVFITGFSPSVVRAAVMAAAVLAGRILYRQTDVLTNISLAALVLLLANPYSLFDVGFQLSFTATLALVLFYPSLRRCFQVKWIPEGITAAVAVTTAAQIGVMPVAALVFNKISLISFLSNLLVLPVLQLITILGFLMAILGQIFPVIAQLLGYINCTFLSFMLLVSKISAALPFAVLRVASPSIAAVGLYYAAVGYFLWYRPKTGHKLKIAHYTAAAVVMAFILGMTVLSPKALEVYFLDVGQGDSAFIRTPSGKNILVDGGGSQFDGSANMGEMVVLPFLLELGVHKLDLVVATHGHDDHINGLFPVIHDLEVERLVIPEGVGARELEPLVTLAGTEESQINHCRQGDTITLDKAVSFKVLNPGPGDGQESSQEKALNNGSLVLKLIYGECSVLLTGDMEQETEQKLLESGADLEADVLKVGHHGSISSTSPAFLKAVMPKAAVISVGSNHFGHPSQEVLKRIQAVKARFYRTDLDGAVYLRCSKNSLSINKTVGD